MADAFLIGPTPFAGDGSPALFALIGGERVLFEPGQGVTTTPIADLATAQAIFDGAAGPTAPAIDFIYASNADDARAAFAQFEDDGFVITAIDELAERRGIVITSLGLADPDNLDPPPGERPEDFRLVVFGDRSESFALEDLAGASLIALAGPAAEALVSLLDGREIEPAVTSALTLEAIERLAQRVRPDAFFVPAADVDRFADGRTATVISPFTDDAPIVLNAPDAPDVPEEPEEPDTPDDPDAPDGPDEPETPEEPAEPPAENGPTEGDDTLDGGAGRDVIEGGGGRDRLSGFEGRDTLFGGDGDDVLRGGIDNDRLRGGDGDDVVRGQGGADRLFGQMGDDTLIGGAGEDTIKGGAGDDRLVGGGAADRLFGGLGDDTLIGSAGEDRLVGSAGDDALTGGTGADRFIFRAGGGDDAIADFEQGVDLMRIQTGAESFADLTIEQVGADVVVSFSDASIRLIGATLADVTGDDFLF